MSDSDSSQASDKSDMSSDSETEETEDGEVKSDLKQAIEEWELKVHELDLEIEVLNYHIDNEKEAITSNYELLRTFK